MKSRRLAAAVVFVCTTVCAQTVSTHVRTAQGELSGSEDETVYSFRGIPFASPPVGDLRWKPPVAPVNWAGTRQATEFGPSCPQTIVDEVLPWTKEFMAHGKTSEDCLYLNVWTPSVNREAHLPVIVFIHGGGFSGGSGSISVYDGANLARTGLVVVNFNYRLGVLGFLALPQLSAESPKHVSGNYGILDQIAALHWVKTNIAGFGGDPTRVTIWGQSAGAASVALLLTSPLAEDAFARAAADSGIGYSGLPVVTLAAAEKEGADFAASLKTTSLKQLRDLPPSAFLPPDPFKAPRFAPNVDGWVVPGPPNELLRTGRGQNKPLITGFQAADGRPLFKRVKTVAEFRDYIATTYGSSAPEILKQYSVTSDAQVPDAIDAVNSDRTRVSVWLFAKSRAQAQSAPTYGYFFTRAIPWPAHPEFGAFHTGEIPYFFKNLNELDRPFTDQDQRISEAASTYLRNFAATGNPNGSGLTKWPAAGAADGQVMNFGDTTHVIGLPDQQKVELWQHYFTGADGPHAPFL